MGASGRRLVPESPFAGKELCRGPARRLYIPKSMSYVYGVLLRPRGTLHGMGKRGGISDELQNSVCKNVYAFAVCESTLM